jgi:hypothetical protein
MNGGGSAGQHRVFSGVRRSVLLGAGPIRRPARDGFCDEISIWLSFACCSGCYDQCSKGAAGPHGAPAYGVMPGRPRLEFMTRVCLGPSAAKSKFGALRSRGGRGFRSHPYASVDVPGRPNELGGLKECSEFIHRFLDRNEVAAADRTCRAALASSSEAHRQFGRVSILRRCDECPHRGPLPPASRIGSKKRRDHFVGGFRAVKLRRSLPRPRPSVAIGAGLSVSVSVSAALSNGKPHFFGENPGQFGSCWDRQ